MADLKLEHALEVVRAVFCDTTVPTAVTRERLVAIREEITVSINAIDEHDGEEDEAMLGEGETVA